MTKYIFVSHLQLVALMPDDLWSGDVSAKREKATCGPRQNRNRVFMTRNPIPLDFPFAERPHHG